MLDKPTWFDLLRESGLSPIVPYIDWPYNILNFVESAISLNSVPVIVEDPDRTRGIFLYKQLKHYKKKFYPVKNTLLVLDSKEWRPFILQPLVVKGGADSVYKIVSTEQTVIYSPADDFSFRKLLQVDEGASLYGMLKK
jgi:hypothetical protein